MENEDKIMLLSGDSLRLLIEKCSDNKGFIGAVLFNSRQGKDDFLTAMKEANATWRVNKKYRRILKLQRHWCTSYADDDKNDILLRLQEKYE